MESLFCWMTQNYFSHNSNTVENFLGREVTVSNVWDFFPYYFIYYTTKEMKVGFAVETFLHLNDKMLFLGKYYSPC